CVAATRTTSESFVGLRVDGSHGDCDYGRSVVGLRAGSGRCLTVLDPGDERLEAVWAEIEGRGSHGAERLEEVAEVALDRDHRELVLLGPVVRDGMGTKVANSKFNVHGLVPFGIVMVRPRRRRPLDQ